jgi:hypothetical protein
MANVIKLRNSGTANSAPTSLEAGELAINYADGKIYYKNSSNAIVQFSSAGGSGITVSETPPSSPSAGNLWYESDSGKTFIYYDSYWVELAGADGSNGTVGTKGDKGEKGDEGGSVTLTTKGDILTRSTSSIARIGVGSDGQVLAANSSTSVGLEWLTITASPTFTGVPLAPTAANTTSNTQIATTAYVKTVINDLINSAPATLDTLGEIAASLANNATLSSTLTSSIATKAPLASPTFTGTVTIPTGASIIAPTGLVKGDVGLGSVDNTTDLNKPISNAAQTALNLKANIASPTFTGTVVLPGTTTVGSVTGTEIGYLSGVTSAIQTQIGAKQKLIPYSSSAPVSPSEGDLWVDSTVPAIKSYISGIWTSIGGSASDSEGAVIAAAMYS